jgi:hypothetical protein
VGGGAVFGPPEARWLFEGHIYFFCEIWTQDKIYILTGTSFD